VKRKPLQIAKIAETKGTKNYAQNKASENLQKIAELEGTINTPSEGTNNYAQTKTSKNLQKLPSWRGK
jgi:hypothetical protein